MALVLGGLALLWAPAAAPVLTTNQGEAAQRNTSTQGMTVDELAAYQLQGEFRGFLGTPMEQSYF